MDNTKNYITIKQFSDSVNLSRQYVYRELTGKFKDYLIEVDNKKYLKRSILEDFKDTNIVTPKQSPLQTTLQSPIDNQLTTCLQAEIDRLLSDLQEKKMENMEIQDQLNIEREYNRQQTNKITALAEKMLELTSNSQKLQLADKVMSNKNISPGTDELPGENEGTPKGFFKRFFKSK